MVEWAQNTKYLKLSSSVAYVAKTSQVGRWRETIGNQCTYYEREAKRASLCDQISSRYDRKRYNVGGWLRLCVFITVYLSVCCLKRGFYLENCDLLYIVELTNDIFNLSCIIDFFQKYSGHLSLWFQVRPLIKGSGLLITRAASANQNVTNNIPSEKLGKWAPCSRRQLKQRNRATTTSTTTKKWKE